jgi:hypothetical protein
MRKRIGAMVALPLVIGLVASMTLAGSVFAAPWKSVSVTQVGPCDFSVWYSWGGQGHGSDLKAAVELGAFDQYGNSNTVGYFSQTGMSGHDGILSHTFHVATGSTEPVKFKGYGFLQVMSKTGQLLTKSEGYSTGLVPAGYVVCQ